MKQQKKLFDLFRDSKHKLDEAPNPQVWMRLEKRLDSRRTKRRSSSIFQIMAMAAGILLLIGVFSLLPALNQRQAGDDAIVLNRPPSEMEDLIVDPNSDQDIIKVVEFSRKYQDRMVQPIEEGSSAKKLVPNNLIQPNEVKKSKGIQEDTISKVKG